MISIVMPAREEKYLQKTIDSMFDRAEGTIEIVVVLDGYWPNPPIKDRDNLVLIHHGESRGMRAAINTAVAASKYEYILKFDAHCTAAKGFDKQLVEDCKEWNWVLVPTRYSLDTRTWDRREDKKYEFEYFCSEDLKGKRWPEYAERVEGQQICDLLTTQGSCWFMTRKMWDFIEGEDEGNYGYMGREAQEICLKTWLSGGRFVLTRNTWYAHWSKSRGHVVKLDRSEKQKSVDYAKRLWLNDAWPKATRRLSWLIEKFAPVPTWDGVTKKTGELMEINNKVKKYKGMSRAGMYKYFASLGFNKGAEVGVQRGRNALVMFQNIPDLELTLVDPYEDHPYNIRTFGKINHQKFKKMAAKRFNGYKVNWLYGFSEDMACKVKDESLDFVYIDGEHFYQFVMLDLILWYRKVRQGGIIAGHDYRKYASKKRFKVMEAVNNFTDAYGISLIYITDNSVIENPGDDSTSFFFIKEHSLESYKKEVSKTWKISQ